MLMLIYVLNLLFNNIPNLFNSHGDAKSNFDYVIHLSKYYLLNIKNLSNTADEYFYSF